ncbi:MAG: SusC/RagA family TonB-linked outer membrane protein [Bacteroidales bacterium]
MRKILLASYLLLVGLAQFAMAQDITVRGTVTSAEDGMSLPGVTVMVQGTTTGATTDFNGNFELRASSNAVLVFSFMGMQTLQEPVNGRSVINVSLSSAMVGLEEVVVMAYGARRRGAITGSVDVVDAQAIEQIPIASFDQILQGKSAGMQVTAASGRPGSSALVRVRGLGSISANNQPLYVIDGVPITVAENFASFATLNPNDILSVSVLKDASATSLYGSRAANGVVMITTKRGEAGKTRFNFRHQTGVSTRTSGRFEMMNAREKLQYEKQMGIGLGATLTNEEIQQWDVNTNWADKFMDRGITQSYELSASGGTDQTRVYLSGQYFDHEGIVKGTYLERYTGRLNVDHRISERFDIGANLTIGHSTEGIVRSDRNVLNPFFSSYIYNPYEALYLEDGSYNFNFDSGINTFEHIEMNPRYDENIKALGNAFMSFRIMPQLTFRSTIGGDFDENLRYQYNKPESGLSQLLGGAGYRNDSYNRYFTTLFTNTLTYDAYLSELHRLRVLGGSEYQRYTYKGFTAEGSGFSTGRIDAMGTAAVPEGVAGGTSEWVLMSYLSQISYEYDQTYFVDLSFRTDGSSRFGEDQRWGNFWAVGAGWNIEQMDFMSNVELVNNLKLRSSVGTSGNFAIGNYAWQGVYSYGSYNGQSTSFQARLGNPSLTWERNFSMGAGIDYALWNNRITGAIDWYSRTTSDLLLAAQLSRTSGFTSRTENIGEMRNRGFEFSANVAVLESPDWRVNLGGSFSTNKNEVLSLYQGNDINVGWNNIISEGKPIYSYKMVRWAGVNPLNGDRLYYNANGDITNVYNPDDAVILDKTPMPDYFGAVNASVGYKGFDLSASFYYSIGNWVYNHVSYFTMGDGSANFRTNQNRKILTDQWLHPGDITDVPRLSPSNNAQLSDRFLEDASYLRLRNLTLSYNLPANLLSSLRMSTARLYVQGQNLWTLTAFTGFDPELGNAPAGMGSGPEGAVHDFNFPAARTVTFGVDIGF